MCYNTPDDELSRCLDSLSGSAVGSVTIVDNSSNEGTRRLLATTYPHVDYIANANTGYGAGHNIALRRTLENADVQYHLVVNADVSFDHDIIGELTAYLDIHPTAALIHPRVVHPNGRLQPTCRLLPTPANLIMRRFCPPIGCLLDRRYLLERYDHRSAPVRVPYVQGSFMLLRTAALRETGLFDERFFMYPEDIDLCRRLRERHDIIYYPAVTITHDHHAASYHSLRMAMIHSINMVRYFNKWGWIFDRTRRRLNRDTLREIFS